MTREEILSRAYRFIASRQRSPIPRSVQAAHIALVTDFAEVLYQDLMVRDEMMRGQITDLLSMALPRPILLPASSLNDLDV